MKRRTRYAATALFAGAILANPPASANDCAVEPADYCVCCPPSDCRAEREVCPGGAGGLVLLEAKNPDCSVRAYEAASCVSGGMIASERRSDLSVYCKGASARIDLSGEQLDELVRQLEKLAR